MYIGTATALVARVWTLPTFENLTWDPPNIVYEVLIHYSLDHTIFSTLVASLLIYIQLSGDLDNFPWLD